MKYEWLTVMHWLMLIIKDVYVDDNSTSFLKIVFFIVFVILGGNFFNNEKDAWNRIKNRKWVWWLKCVFQKAWKTAYFNPINVFIYIISLMNCDINSINLFERILHVYILYKKKKNVVVNHLSRNIDFVNENEWTVQKWRWWQSHYIDKNDNNKYHFKHHFLYDCISDHFSYILIFI